METLTVPADASEWNQRGAEFLPGYLGVEILKADPEEVSARIPVSTKLCAPNGYLHAGTVVTLADTCCGYGTVLNLPDGAVGFTTIELKSNFLGTALDGDLVCSARPSHVGRTTQVWDAEVMSEASGRTIAIFRCTQLVLRPAGS